MPRTFMGRITLPGLAAAFVAAAGVAYSFGDGATLSSAIGGGEVAGCKGPCSTGDAAPVIECLDGIQGQPCDTNYCTNNEVRIVQCAVGNPGAEDPKCKTKTNANDWWRRATVRREACTNGGASGAVPYGDACTMSGTGGTAGSTPDRKSVV